MKLVVHTLRSLVALAVLLAFASSGVSAQGVTTGSLAGVVTDQGGVPVAGANVIAIHVPSGSTYEATTRADGRFLVPGMRVGGPYSVTVAYQGNGTAFEPFSQDNVVVNLGVATDLPVTVRSIAVTETVTVTASTSEVFSSTRTGAATTVVLEQIANLPNVSNRLENFTRLTPQASGSSFAGQDNRLNNITVDGSYFNNSFGLGGQPRRAHRRRADLARGHRADAGQRRALRRAPGQLRRRRREHGHAQRHQPLHRLALPSVPQRGHGRHRGQGTRVQPRHVRVRQHRRLSGRPDPQEQAVLLRQRGDRDAQAARHDLPRQPRRRGRRWAT